MNLMEIMGGISDEHITEFAYTSQKRGRIKLLARIASAVACLALIAGGTAFAVWRGGKIGTSVNHSLPSSSANSGNMSYPDSDTADKQREHLNEIMEQYGIKVNTEGGVKVDQARQRLRFLGFEIPSVFDNDLGETGYVRSSIFVIDENRVIVQLDYDNGYIPYEFGVYDISTGEYSLLYRPYGGSRDPETKYAVKYADKSSIVFISYNDSGSYKYICRYDLHDGGTKIMHSNDSSGNIMLPNVRAENDSLYFRVISGYNNDLDVPKYTLYRYDIGQSGEASPVIENVYEPEVCGGEAFYYEIGESGEWVLKLNSGSLEINKGNELLIAESGIYKLENGTLTDNSASEVIFNSDTSEKPRVTLSLGCEFGVLLRGLDSKVLYSEVDFIYDKNTKELLVFSDSNDSKYTWDSWQDGLFTYFFDGDTIKGYIVTEKNDSGVRPDTDHAINSDVWYPPAPSVIVDGMWYTLDGDDYPLDSLPNECELIGEVTCRGRENLGKDGFGSWFKVGDKIYQHPDKPDEVYVYTAFMSGSGNYWYWRCVT